jgi:RHS repeat-associated protein
VPAGNPAYPRVPGGSAIADLSYAYSGGQRVLKGSSVAGAAPKYAVEVLGTLRLNGAAYDEGTQSYERSRYTETGYMAGFARVEYDPYVPRVQLSPDQEPVHVFLSIGDHLGSTSVVIESSTSEVVEKATFLSHGAIESDYRPTRWQGFREEYKFTGKEEDVEVGLTYFGARYYHARLQRFASPDPLTVHGIAGDLNPYAYVSGRTMNHVDPWGLDKTPTVEVHGVRREPSPSTDVHQAMAESTAAYQAQLQRDPKAVEFAKAVGQELVNNSLPGRIKKGAELAQQKPKPKDVAKGFIRARLEKFPTVHRVLLETALDQVAPAGDSPGEELGKMAEDAQTQWVGAVLTVVATAGPQIRAPASPGAPALDDLSRAGRQLDPSDKGGLLTRAGRALQKHRAGGRPGASKFPGVRGGPANWNAAGQDLLDDILTTPGGKTTPLGRGGWQVTTPDGRAARFNANGAFSGFIEVTP